MNVQKPDPFIAVIAAHLARDADCRPLNYDGQLGNRAQHAKSLKRYEELIGRLLLDFPRLDGEGPEQWRSRVVSKSPRKEDAGVLGMAGRLQAVLTKMDRDAEDEARRQQAAAAARREAERDQHRRAAMPDMVELAQLKRTIDGAAEGERLLAQMYAAFTAHKSAQAARARLNVIFDSARGARNALRVDGEAVAKPLPKQPTTREAPEGAIAFATLIQRVIGLQRH